MAMTHFILYVQNQSRSTAFYTEVLGMEPELNVPGMTEFRLSAETILGLMPSRGIERLLGSGVADGAPASGTARGELYFVVEDPESHHRRALAAGARELSGLSLRDWGDKVAYSIAHDGYVLAFASRWQTQT